MTSGAAASPLQNTAAPQAVSPRALVVTFGSILAPNHGLAVRARTMIEAFDRLGMHSSVISHWEPDGLHSSVFESLHVLRRPLRLGWSFELARAVRARQAGVDVIVVESALLLPAVRAARPRAPIVWDTNECETLHYARVRPSASNRLRGFVWRLIERSSVARADVIVAISETEAGWWRRLFPASSEKLVVVDHCAPAVRVAPRPARADLDRLCSMTARGPVLLFVGNLLGKHNADAARWLMEDLAPRLPAQCTLVLAGPGTDEVPPPESASALLCRLGAVSDIDAVIAGADLCLAPLAAGAGVKTKVLHYLAHGKRVIATPVALEGIEDAPGVEARALDDFPSAIRSWIGRRDDPTDRGREELQRAWLDARYGRARVADQWRDALATAGVSLP
jgi:glycosyltransferase involved in cell wall biosynthesis